MGGNGGEAGKGTVLALAILLLWLAGVALFVAFEGASILGENPAPNAGGGTNWFKTILRGLTSQAAATAQAQAASAPIPASQAAPSLGSGDLTGNGQQSADFNPRPNGPGGWTVMVA